jgi:hypothetical protein
MFVNDDVIEKIQDYSIPYLVGNHQRDDSFWLCAAQDCFTMGITAQHTSYSYTTADTDRDP